MPKQPVPYNKPFSLYHGTELEPFFGYLPNFLPISGVVKIFDYFMTDGTMRAPICVVDGLATPNRFLVNSYSSCTHTHTDTHAHTDTHTHGQRYRYY